MEWRKVTVELSEFLEKALTGFACKKKVRKRSRGKNTSRWNVV